LSVRGRVIRSPRRSSPVPGRVGDAGLIGHAESEIARLFQDLRSIASLFLAGRTPATYANPNIEGELRCHEERLRVSFAQFAGLRIRQIEFG
jgi:hypothetical protein